MSLEGLFGQNGTAILLCLDSIKRKMNKTLFHTSGFTQRLASHWPAGRLASRHTS